MDTYRAQRQCADVPLVGSPWRVRSNYFIIFFQSAASYSADLKSDSYEIDI